MFEIKKSTFEKYIKIAELASSSRGVDPIRKSILVTSNKDDKTLILRSNNEVMEVIVTFMNHPDVKITKSEEVCIENFIVKVLGTMPSGEVKFTKSAKNLNSSINTKRNRFALLDTNEFPKEIKIHGLEYQEVGKEIVDWFRFCGIAVAEIADRPIYQTFFINPHTKTLMTGDGDQICRWVDLDLPGNIAHPDASMINPVLSLIKNLLGDKDTLNAFFGKWSSFELNLWDEQLEAFTLRIEAKIISAEGEFSEKAEEWIKKLTEKKPELSFNIKKKDLLPILDTCLVYFDKIYSEGKSNSHTVITAWNDRDKPYITFTMDIPNYSELREEVPCENIEGNLEYQMFFHSKDLHEAVTVMGENLIFKFYGNKTPFLVFDGDNSNIIYFQVPMVET